MQQIDQAVLVSLFTATLTGGFFGFVQFLIKRHDDKVNNVEVKNELIEDALLAILHDKIYVTGSKILQEGSISAEDANNLDHLYKPYKALGGNGTCERIINQINELPIKVKEK